MVAQQALFVVFGYIFVQALVPFSDSPWFFFCFSVCRYTHTETKCYLDTRGNTMTKGMVAIQVGVDRRLSTLQYFEQLSPRILSTSISSSGTLGGRVMLLNAQYVQIPCTLDATPSPFSRSLRSSQIRYVIQVYDFFFFGVGSVSRGTANPFTIALPSTFPIHHACVYFSVPVLHALPRPLPPFPSLCSRFVQPINLNITIGGRECVITNYEALRDDSTSCSDVASVELCIPRKESLAIIQCTVPAGEGRNQEVVISLNDRKSEARMFHYDPPLLLSTVVQDDGTELDAGWSTRGSGDTSKWAWLRGALFAGRVPERSSEGVECGVEWGMGGGGGALRP
jgi:hypothetical protein